MIKSLNDMAINKKLIHFKNKQKFEDELANKQILNTSIVFIQDSKEISTHGTLYKTVNWSVLEAPELYEWVDLGLPSGLKWAAWNVGAEKPEDFGLYFAWGETEGYSGITDTKKFNWSDYELCGGSSSTLTKYNSTVDNLTTLEQVDDAAYQSDNTCRMPTKADFEELIANTTSVWETLNGVNGKRFTSKRNGNSIFVPAAGFYGNGIVGFGGKLWSSSLYESSPMDGWNLVFISDYMDVDYSSRYNGFSVRAVKSNN